MDQLIETLIRGLGLLWIHATFWFIVSIVIKRNDIADVAWGIGFCMLSLWLFVSFPFSWVALLLFTIVCVWALRLSLHIFNRNLSKKEDFRYLQWRQEWGNTFYWRSYVQVFLLQSLFLFMISLPLFWASVFPATASIFTWIGFGVWCTGFFIQALADHQLTQFKKRQSGKIMQEGLWKYSRHPNYFGEIVMWWGVFTVVLPLPFGFLTIISPLTITFLLVFVSGVPMLEKKYEGNLSYEVYKKNTWSLVPKLW